MPHLLALIGKGRFPFPHLLGPLGLALLMGCTVSEHALRLETGQHEPVVRLARGDRAPVDLAEDAFKETLAAWAPGVRLPAQPLQEARRLWLAPSQSDPYAATRRHLGLVSLGTQEDVPRAQLLQEPSGADAEITRGYGLWCQARAKLLDCLQLFEGGALLGHDGKRALALHFAMASLWLETKDALGQMVDPLALQATIVSAMTMYFMLWMLPEPVSKGLAATMTVALIGYLGIDTVWSLFQGWAQLVEDVDKAISFDQVRDSGRRFSKVMGPNAARVFVMLFTVAAGNTVAGFASKLPALPGATQAAMVAQAQTGARLSLAATVDTVTVSSTGATLVLAPGAVAMASQGDSSGGNNAKGDTTVYISKTPAGRIQYVGITNELARRAAEQLRAKGIRIQEFMSSLSREDARAVEQALIELYGLQKNGGTLLNRINSIARSNPRFAAM